MSDFLRVINFFLLLLFFSFLFRVSLSRFKTLPFLFLRDMLDALLPLSFLLHPLNSTTKPTARIIMSKSNTFFFFLSHFTSSRRRRRSSSTRPPRTRRCTRAASTTASTASCRGTRRRSPPPEGTPSPCAPARRSRGGGAWARGRSPPAAARPRPKRVSRPRRELWPGPALPRRAWRASRPPPGTRPRP